MRHLTACSNFGRIFLFSDLGLGPRSLEYWPRGKNWNSSFFVNMYINSYVFRFKIIVNWGCIWPVIHWRLEVKNENGNIFTICTSIPIFLGSLITKMNSDFTLISSEAAYGLYDIDLWRSKMKMVSFQQYAHQFLCF